MGEGQGEGREGKKERGDRSLNPIEKSCICLIASIEQKFIITISYSFIIYLFIIYYIYNIINK